MKFCYGAIIAATLVGCGTTIETTPLNSPPRPLASRDPSSVEVYSSTAPARPHVDVALLRANQTNLDSADTAGMLRELLKRAASMGCDAIMIGGAAERAGAPLGSGYELLDPGSHALLATCMAYLPNAL